MTGSRRRIAAVLAGGVLAVVASSRTRHAAPSGLVAPSPPAVTVAPGPSGPSALPSARHPSPSAAKPAAGSVARGAVPVRACSPADLRVTLGPSESGAGSTHTTVDVVNLTSRLCTLRGYPQLTLRTPTGPIGQPATRDASVPPSTVLLATGRSAHATLVTSDAHKYDPQACAPQTATVLRVQFPADLTSRTDLAVSLTVCAGNVARPSGQPFTAGR